MNNNSSVFLYHSLNMIMMNLEDSIGLIADFENWGQREDEQIEQLKTLSKQNNLKSTLFVVKSREMNYGLWNLNNIIKKANKQEINYVIFYSINSMMENMSEIKLFKDIENFLCIRKMIVAKDYVDSNFSKLSTQFIQENWKDNAIVVENIKTDDLEKNLELLKESKFSEFKQQNNLSYQFDARVEEGKKLGRTIGFPTINLITKKRIALTDGVYACKVYIDRLKETFLGAGCYWKNELNQEVFEIFLIDFDQEIYGWKVSITPLKKIRENIEVEGLDELKELLANDVKETLKYKN